MDQQIAETLAQLEHAIKDRYDPLGCVAGDDGAYMTGHVPHVAPYAYLCWRYAGLDEAGLTDAETEADRYLPEPYRAFLAVMNGARLLGISFHGTVGGAVDRSGIGIGQPISLRYQNTIERPDYVPEGHLGIAAINGPWFSQGHLYLASTGEVELYNARFNIIGARWPSLAKFLEDEMSRRFSLYGSDGRRLENAKLLPGDTEDWEQLAQEAKGDPQRGLVERLMKPFRRG